MLKREINWDAAAAIIASLIGLLALAVAGYTAYVQRQQVRASVWPYLQLGESDFLPGDNATTSHGGLLAVLNKGVGPATVRSVQVWVDGKPQPDWRHVFKALGYRDAPGYIRSSVNHTVLSPGEHLDVLKVLGQDAWAGFKEKFVHHMIIRACYCSTLGDCWQSTLNMQDPTPQGQPVGSCASPRTTVQFGD
jgi:hypothetical protein